MGINVQHQVQNVSKEKSQINFSSEVSSDLVPTQICHTPEGIHTLALSLLLFSTVRIEKMKVLYCTVLYCIIINRHLFTVDRCLVIFGHQPITPATSVCSSMPTPRQVLLDYLHTKSHIQPVSQTCSFPAENG